MRRLVLLGLDAESGPTPTRPCSRSSDNAGKLALAGSPYPSVAELVDDVEAGLVLDLVDAAPEVAQPRRRTTRWLPPRAADRRPRLAAALREVTRVLEAWRAADKRAVRPRRAPACCRRSPTCAASSSGWCTAGFVGEAGLARLRHYRATSRRWRCAASGCRTRWPATAS